MEASKPVLQDLRSRVAVGCRTGIGDVVAQTDRPSGGPAVARHAFGMGVGRGHRTSASTQRDDGRYFAGTGDGS